MKFISFILLVCIVALMVQPALSFAAMNNAASKKEICMKMCCCKTNGNATKKEPASKGCCASNACNPFMNCGCCPYFLNKETITLPVTVSDSVSFHLVNDKVYSSYQTDFFHPPNFSAA